MEYFQVSVKQISVFNNGHLRKYTDITTFLMLRYLIVFASIIHVIYLLYSAQLKSQLYTQSFLLKENKYSE